MNFIDTFLKILSIIKLKFTNHQSEIIKLYNKNIQNKNHRGNKFTTKKKPNQKNKTRKEEATYITKNNKT